MTDISALRGFVAIVLVGLLVLPAGLQAAPAEEQDPSAGALHRFLQDRGLDASRFFAADAQVERHHADGSVVVTTERLEDVLSGSGFAGALLPFGSGYQGAPHLVTGNVLHGYSNVAPGDARAYVIKSWPWATSTPAAGAPGTPFTPGYYHAGGNLKSVKGADYETGFHYAGRAAGISVDVAETGPYLPIDPAAALPNSRVDFFGYASVMQTQTCVDGQCLAFGLLWGSGMALMDDESLAFPAPP